MMLENITCHIAIGGQTLEGDLAIPALANAIILFAHGSGSSRHSRRNRYVAEVLNKAGFATLLVDLLTAEEKRADIAGQRLRFNIELLAKRFRRITNWILQNDTTKALKIGYFGSSTGAAAAIIAAASFSINDTIKAIVLRSGRLDLAEAHHLQMVNAPTLLIIGGSDSRSLIESNRSSLKKLVIANDRQLAVISGAGHLFEEPGKIEEVARISADWFNTYLLCTGKKFENKVATKQKSFSALLSGLHERTHFQLKFKDRVAAGEILASSLSKYKKQHDKKDSDSGITIIGIPRGGVLVADAIARKMAINDLDIVISRKLRAPDNPENAIGAIMQDGSMYLSKALVQSVRMTDQYLEIEKSEQVKEIHRRLRLYRPETTREYKIKDRIVILVDDGADTGSTVIAAAEWIRKLEPERLIIALPVAPSQVKRELRQQADFVEIIHSPSNLRSVEQYYQSFPAVSDHELIRLLQSHRLGLREPI